MYAPPTTRTTQKQFDLLKVIDGRIIKIIKQNAYC